MKSKFVLKDLLLLILVFSITTMVLVRFVQFVL